MTANEVKEALRRRHPAGFDGPMIRQWTCIEEWANIDLLALDAWSKSDCIGYEVKVSRADYRRELVEPEKRAAAVAMCTRFYFAVPKGLLRPEEISGEPPAQTALDFEAMACTNPACMFHGRPRSKRYGPRSTRGPRDKGTDREGASVYLGYDTDSGYLDDGSHYSHTYRVEACCVVCGGRGVVRRSSAEEAAGKALWVPEDVGLVEVSAQGCRVAKQAPHNPTAPGPLGASNGGAPKETRYALHRLLRHVSARPDPRHAAARGR